MSCHNPSYVHIKIFTQIVHLLVQTILVCIKRTRCLEYICKTYSNPIRQWDRAEIRIKVQIDIIYIHNINFYIRYHNIQTFITRSNVIHFEWQVQFFVDWQFLWRYDFTSVCCPWMKSDTCSKQGYTSQEICMEEIVTLFLKPIHLF